MRIHLAGTGPDDRMMQMRLHLATQISVKQIVAQMAGHHYRLFSYWYVKSFNDPTVVSDLKEADSTIMDSGLFSFMFGASKDVLPATYEAYRDYTVQYLADLDKWNYRGWRVEADTHRLLGMEATVELRKLFVPYEDRTIFVWHQPEGLDGLERLALRYDYIALSIPELRMISGNGTFGGGSDKVPRMANDLLDRIIAVCKRNGVKPPRVHLLGCTVERMMQTSKAYSCDSTSWLSGVRYGNGYAWSASSGLESCGLRSEKFLNYRAKAVERFPEVAEFARHQSNEDYYLNTLACAHAFGEYQKWLDTRFSPIEMRGKSL